MVPELITGADPGELFDVRNIANVVPPAASAACATGAAVEYAVIHLKVRHIVVCGHTECGGIKALESPPEPANEPHIASWLELARPAREKVLNSDVAETDRYLETIKTNVLMQCGNLRSYPCVADGEKSGGLAVHPCSTTCAPARSGNATRAPGSGVPSPNPPRTWRSDRQTRFPLNARSIGGSPRKWDRQRLFPTAPLPKRCSRLRTPSLPATAVGVVACGLHPHSIRRGTRVESCCEGRRTGSNH